MGLTPRLLTLLGPATKTGDMQECVDGKRAGFDGMALMHKYLNHTHSWGLLHHQVRPYLSRLLGEVRSVKRKTKQAGVDSV